MVENSSFNRHVFLVSTNAGQAMGGEAIKAYQFFIELAQSHGHVTLVTHGRCHAQLEHLMEDHDIELVEDDAFTIFLWRSRILRFLVNVYFHLQVRRLLLRIAPQKSDVVLHYVCPISPVLPRFPPRGYRAILGPLNGNIGYPPAFAAREGHRSRLVHRAQLLVQRLMRLVSREKQHYKTILVSGYERTMVSLRQAGARDDQLVEVADCGISDAVFETDPIVHAGRNTRFICSGRLIGLKGFDMAIRAVAQAPSDVTLDIYGDGEMAASWAGLVEELGLTGRVRLCGWCDHETLMKRMRDYRGYVFPTLCEANGIVMQEAMAIGLPVITLDWGGPSRLADEESAILIAPEGEYQVVAGLAQAMTRLAADADMANKLALKARSVAETRFPWSKVCKTWACHYECSSNA